MKRGHASDVEKGSLTLELVVLCPVIVLFVILALSLGRFELAREQVIGAARAAAEAASVAPSAGQAEEAAQAAAAPVVEGETHSCEQLSVTTDTSNFVPGGFVRVVVACQIDNRDLVIPGVPGRSEVQVSETAPIDPFRSVQ